MQVLLDNKKISNYSLIQEGMNSLGYESLNEVFFDVFEIKSNGVDMIKEKKGDFNGFPIIELDLSINNEIYKNVRFVLKETNQILINPNLLDYTKAIVVESLQPKTIKVEKKEIPKSVQKLESVKPKKVITENKQVKREKTLLEKTKEEFFNSIRGELLESLKEEIKAGIIADLLKDNIQSNFDNIVEEGSNQYKLQKLFRNENNKFRKELVEMSEKVARRESMRFAESGGGTNAVQYANGGTMDGDLTVTGKINSNSMDVSQINVDSLSVNTLSTNYEFVIHNLSVTEGITANNILLYDTLSSTNSIYSRYGEFYDLTVNHNLSVTNDAYFYGTLSAEKIIINTSLFTDIITSNYATINHNLSVTNNIVGNTATLSTLNLTSITAANAKVTETLNTSSFVSNYTTVNHTLSVGENIITNYETVNNDLSVLGHLYADQASITNDLTVGGGISSYNGSYILGNVIVTGNLTVSQEIFGDLVSGNTIVNSSGDTLLAKAVKNISGSSFINGNYTVHHNLSSYDLLMTLYYVNSNGTREVVHASMINDTLSTTQISFGSQPESSDQYKLVIMS